MGTLQSTIYDRSQHGDWRDAAFRKERDARLANGLGWFSIGLGVAEVVAPGKIAELIGIRKRDARLGMLRTFGLREIAAGVAILSRPKEPGWVWGRVAGDAVDLAYLGSALASKRANRTRVATATAAVLGVTALDVICGQQLSRGGGNGRAKRRGIGVVKSIVVNRPVEEVYRFWRDFTKLPQFMTHLESVQMTGDRRSHWKAKAPAGQTVEWDAEIVQDEPNSLIAWRSLEGSDVRHCGSVRFVRATGGRGTLIKVELNYNPPGGIFASKLAKLTGEEPGQQIEDDLRHFKQIMEVGEIVRSDASIHKGMHPAQPPQKFEPRYGQ
jgi:uncharacterized membrane protein